MKLVPSTPVTFERSRFEPLWFPVIYRTGDGVIHLTIEYGHDAHWAPFKRTWSTDGGRTWANPVEFTPRPGWCWGFDDGVLLEVDCYGVQDPANPEQAVHYVARSKPASSEQPHIGRCTFHLPHAMPAPLSKLSGSYPTRPWSFLWNDLHGRTDMTAEDIFITGPDMTGGIETADGKLCCVAYWPDKETGRDTTWVYETTDRGDTWQPVGRITSTDPGEPLTNEAAIAETSDGRLYCVMRSDGPLVHAWSSDEGVTWTKPVPMSLEDEPDHTPAHVWPCMKRIANGALVLTYGRPGKHIIIDPTGTGEHWQSRLDLHQNELDLQAARNVPEPKRLRGIVGHDINEFCDRATDSSDYVNFVETSPNELLVTYDVHGFHEHWNDQPHDAVRMVRVSLK